MSDNLIKWLGLSLGWGLVALGALVLLRALFADRPRGRRRCPRCWYLMEGVPGLRCPECGRTVKTERRLLKTRRRWRRALAAGFLILSGVGAMVASGVIRLGWVKAVPSSVLVMVVPIDPKDWRGRDTDVGTAVRLARSQLAQMGMSPNQISVLAPGPTPPKDWRSQLSDELRERADAGDLWHWQTAFLGRRVRAAARAQGDEVVLLDCRDIAAPRWWHGLELPPPPQGNPGLTLASGSRLPATLGQLEKCLGAGVGARSCRAIGSSVLLWNPVTLERGAAMLAAVRAARPGSPAPADRSDWEARAALAERVRTAPVDVDAEHPLLSDVVDAIARAIDAEVALDWSCLWPADIFRDRASVAGPLHTTAAALLESGLNCNSQPLPLRWTVAHGVVIVDRRHVFRYSAVARVPTLTRVYDVRVLLRRSLQQDRLDTDQVEDAFIRQLKQQTDPDGLWEVAPEFLNGRLIVQARLEVHEAIDRFLQEQQSREGGVEPGGGTP